MNKGVIIAGVAVAAIGAAMIVPRVMKPKAVLENSSQVLSDNGEGLFSPVSEPRCSC